MSLKEKVTQSLKTFVIHTNVIVFGKLFYKKALIEANLHYSIVILYEKFISYHIILCTPFFDSVYTF